MRSSRREGEEVGMPPYRIVFTARADEDLQKLPIKTQSRIVLKARALQDGLKGDVKRLTTFTPEYRLRVGDYRVLFEIEGNDLVIHRVRHRKDAY